MGRQRVGGPHANPWRLSVPPRVEREAGRAAPRHGRSAAETTAVPTLLLGSSGTFLSHANTCTAARGSFRELTSREIKYPLSVKTFQLQTLTGMIRVLCVVWKRGIEPHFPVSSCQLTFFCSSFSYNVILFSDSSYNVTLPLRILVKVPLQTQHIKL